MSELTTEDVYVDGSETEQFTDYIEWVERELGFGLDSYRKYVGARQKQAMDTFAEAGIDISHTRTVVKTIVNPFTTEEELAGYYLNACFNLAFFVTTRQTVTAEHDNESNDTTDSTLVAAIRSLNTLVFGLIKDGSPHIFKPEGHITTPDRLASLLAKEEFDITRAPARFRRAPRVPKPVQFSEPSACTNSDVVPEIFFPDEKTLKRIRDIVPRERKSRQKDVMDRYEQAVQLCGSCPVRQQCLDYALENPSIDGIWGGLLHSERKQVLRSKRKKSR